VLPVGGSGAQDPTTEGEAPANHGEEAVKGEGGIKEVNLNRPMRKMVHPKVKRVDGFRWIGKL
jgi:hypothetical protein